MNVFNRIVTVCVALVVLVVILLLAVFPLLSLGWLATGAQVWREYLSYWEVNGWYAYVAVRVGLVVVAVVLFGLLLYLELRRQRTGTVRVVTGEGSTATVVTDSVAQRLVYHIDRLADVVSVVPRVVGRGGTVHVKLDMETGPEIDVPMKTDEVVAVAREVVEEQMGLQLGTISVRIRHAPYPDEIE
jgi:hypothetical protein